jgi:hypothetical protein
MNEQLNISLQVHFMKDRMGLLPDLTMDNAAGLRLSIDPSEAYDQISDCCHK